MKRKKERKRDEDLQYVTLKFILAQEMCIHLSCITLEVNLTVCIYIACSLCTIQNICVL